MGSTKEYLQQVILWVGLFVIFSIAPLGVSLIGHDLPSRGFWVEYGVGLGFVSIALFGLQFVLTARFRNIAPAFGTDAMLQFHRQAGIVAYFFLIAHVVVLMVANPAFLVYFDPTVNAARTIALITVLIISTALMVTTLWRLKLSISYEWWRVTHGVFALGVVFIGLAHLLQVGFYVDELWKQTLWVLMTGVAIALLLHARLYKPLKMSKKPYRVTNVQRQTDTVWTMSLEPEGHDGFDFDAGQFAWLTVGPSPFSLQQNPFSFSSSEDDKDRYQFTIKELGDFTNSIEEDYIGKKAFLEGPYGSFTLDQASSRHIGFIVGGIGVTPVMSMLRTLHDRGSDLKITMMYGNVSWDDVTFKKELEVMQEELDMTLVHVVENPPDDWDGEEGLISKELLEKYFPIEDYDIDYYTCGPEPMMDIAEETLRDNGVELHRTHSERFNIV